MAVGIVNYKLGTKQLSSEKLKNIVSFATNLLGS
jgi:hypothetical protein